MAVEALLLETGDYLLLEDGTSHLLLESSTAGGSSTLFREVSSLDGIGAGGPFFKDPLQ